MKRIIRLLAAAAAMPWITIAWAQENPKLDPLAAKNVELTVYLVSGVQTPPSDDVPADLAATVKQLHSLFSYKGYKLAESFILRGRGNGNGVTNEGVLSGSGLHYRFYCNRLRMSPEKPYMLHLDSLSFTISGTPTYGTDGKQRNSTVASISTDLDLVEGQKTVIGKSSINSTDALILVIVPKVIE
jgi:hypothetical protein